MEKIVIRGGQPLYGEIETSGMKNAALPIIFGCLLVKDTCTIENLPSIDDVRVALTILEDMGASAKYLNPTTVRNTFSVKTVKPYLTWIWATA